MSNIVLNPGSGGSTLGTDVDGSSINYQIVKLGVGLSGNTPTQVSSSNPLPENLAQVGGNATKTGSGNGSTGSLNVYLATDQPALTNALPVLQSGSWSVTANIGTSGSLALDSSVNGLLASQSSASSGAKGPLIQGAVSASAPSYSAGNINPLSLTGAGALRIDGSGVTQPVSGTITANAGTGSFTVAQATASNLNATVTGTVTANAGSGTMAVSAASLPLPSGAAADSSVNGLLVAQGSATSGEKGPLVQGAVVSTGPSYSNGQTSPLTLDTSGNLRVNVVAGGASGGTSLTDGSTFTRGTTAETPVGGVVASSAPTLTAGTAAALSLDTSGNLRVVTSGTGGGSSITDGATFTRGTTAETTAGGVVASSSPSLTAGTAGALSLTTAGALRTDASATTQPVSGTVTVSQATAASLNATVVGSGNFTVVQPTASNLNATVSGTVTANAGTGSFTVAQATASNLNATVTGTVTANAGTGSFTVAQATAANLNATVTGTTTGNQGTANTAANAWPVTLVPQTGNGWSKWSSPNNNSNTPLTNTVVYVKTSAGELGGYIVFNPNSTVAFVQVFDAASGVTLGTTRPAMVIPVPPTSGANLEFANGVSFTSGIGIAATTSDSGSTAPSSGITTTIVYK